MKNLTTLILFLAVLCGGIFPSVVSADVYFTRNAGSDATVNRTPGYWNHAAVDATPDPVTGRPRVAEYQRDAGGLILVDREDFLARYPIIDVIENGVVYEGDGSDGKSYAVFPLFGLTRSNCTTFAAQEDRSVKRLVRIPDVLHAKYERREAIGDWVQHRQQRRAER